MSKETPIVFGENQNKLSETRVNRRRSGSIGEAMMVGMNPREEQELKVAALRSAIIKGEESGPAPEFDMANYISAKRKAKA